MPATDENQRKTIPRRIPHQNQLSITLTRRVLMTSLALTAPECKTDDHHRWMRNQLMM